MLLKYCPSHTMSQCTGKAVLGAKFEALQPLFDHLDPEFLCKGVNLRSRCLDKVNNALIPTGNIPGAWEEPLKPNSELVWFRHFWGAVPGVDSESDIPEHCEVIDYGSL